MKRVALTICNYFSDGGGDGRGSFIGVGGMLLRTLRGRLACTCLSQR